RGGFDSRVAGVASGDGGGAARDVSGEPRVRGIPAGSGGARGAAPLRASALAAGSRVVRLRSLPGGGAGSDRAEKGDDRLTPLVAGGASPSPTTRGGAPGIGLRPATKVRPRAPSPASRLARRPEPGRGGESTRPRRFSSWPGLA